MDIRDRPFYQGLELRVWLPETVANEARAMAERFGWHVTLFARQPQSAGSERYDGVQMAVTIPFDESRELMRPTRQIAAGTRQLKSGQ